MRPKQPVDPQSLAPDTPPLAEGEIDIRVRYCECDPMGVAHHASYIPWLEMGRTELLRPSGVTYARMEEAGLLLAVTRVEIRYRLPAFYDESLLLRTRVSGGGRARIDHAYELLRRTNNGALGDVLATAESTLACLTKEGRPQALPEWLAPKGRRARR
jgi:acyl-CoA thioester hydrolase